MAEIQLNEQWVEELDGKKHMLKLVPSILLCSGCVFSNKTFCSDPIMSERNIDCSKTIIKDLGVLNEDGCLPADFGVYPEVYEHVLMGINGYMVKAYIPDPHVGKYAFGNTKQEAIDAWNRRA